ncbi:MAG: metalloregulator ArsR/SmtB family transcription factor [Gammaproteobacteria bacterium]|nr:metalloregulator ArsR/SmtB family transcription factor [Gammaproteobacteria bacterium]MBT4492204.1 metalloregulator ArsR/SmtB family transcription factor [Gammaproteobacteria bacterium]
MLPAKSLPSDIEELTSYCKATADQQRLTILRVLTRESFGVLELCHILDVAQPALSHHLKVLHTAGLLDTRRQGTSIFYRRAVICASDPIGDLRQSLFDSVDQLQLSTKVTASIDDIHAGRKRQAKEFFEKNAHRFKENQDLIAEYSHYAACIEDLLNDAAISVSAPVIEIGPGESSLIVNLARRFGAVVGIDNTADMLEKTRQTLSQHNIDNCELFLGELNDYKTTSSDLVVANMVLHHLASPAQFFHETSRYLSSSGSLLIADLCAHDQDWTREACGDLWLGFEPEELDNWAQSADFLLGQSAYLGLKNGFQVQVRLFHKQPSP